jgi:hypothetical protein
MAVTQEELEQIVSAVVSTMGTQKKAPRRKSLNFERRLVQEYVQRTYPNWLQWRNVRVGNYPYTEQGMMYAFTRRWADAIVSDGKVIIVIEGKIRVRAGIISQLQLYLSEVYQTPELSKLGQIPVKGQCVVVFDDEKVRQMAEAAGLIWTVYTPSFMSEIMENV